MAKAYDKNAINTTVIIHNMIYDVCKNSSPEKGICLSDTFSEQLKAIKDFNYEFIYKNKRLDAFTEYARLVITQIFETLLDAYDGEETIKTIKCQNRKIYSRLETKEIYMGAIIDYISGMSDNYAIKVFNELITY